MSGRGVSTPLSATRSRQREEQTFSPSSFQRPQTEWTVFGQLMVPEGQIASSPDDPMTPRAMRNRSSILRFGARSRSPAVNRRRGSMGTGSTLYLTGSSVLQSPEQEMNKASSYFSLQSTSPLPATDNRFAQTDYDSDASDDSDATPIPSNEREPPPSKWKRIQSKVPAIPIAYRNMLKCSIAYLIASLFTFEPHLATLFSGLVSYGNKGEARLPLPSGHMVATM